jgi:hypothetical protein
MLLLVNSYENTQRVNVVFQDCKLNINQSLSVCVEQNYSVIIQQGICMKPTFYQRTCLTLNSNFSILCYDLHYFFNFVL